MFRISHIKTAPARRPPPALEIAMDFERSPEYRVFKALQDCIFCALSRRAGPPSR